MKLSDMFFAVLYGVAFILIIYFFITLFYKPSTVIIYDEQPVYYDRVWWPWGTNSYNYWPYWSGWWNGGGGGGYNYYRPRHHGGGIRPHGGSWSGRPWGGSSMYNSGSAPGPSGGGGPSAPGPSGGGSGPSGGGGSGPSGGGGSAPSGP